MYLTRFKNYAALFFLWPMLAFAQIPQNPNKTDEQSRRQGGWTIMFDKAGFRTLDTAAVLFYRLITYQDDKPVGVVTEYHKNKKIR